MYRRKYWLLWICIWIGADVAKESHARLIDDFTQGAVSLSDPLGLGSVADLKIGLDPAHIAAAARHITFNAIDGFPFGDTGIVTVEVDPNDGGSLRHTPDTGLSAANFYVSYGVTSFGLPAMTLDLLEDGAERLVIDFAYTIPNPGVSTPEFAMGVHLKSGNGATSGKFMPIPTSANPFSVEITFAQILGIAPTFDLSDVTEIQIEAGNGTMKGRFAMDTIYTVPEPSTLTFAAFLSLVFAGKTKRRDRRRC